MPKQPWLFPAPAAPRNRSVTHDTRNQETAALILANIEAYGGEGSLPVEWARKITQEQDHA